MSGFQLGPIKFDNGVLCAPICGATKIPYRKLAKEYGADLCYTEMIKAVALVRGKERSFELAQLDPIEHPIGAQLCGAKPDEMAEAGRIVESRGFDTIDINMGCPVPKVVREGAGAALMRDIALMEKVVKSLVSAVSVPVTIKIRSGWTKTSINAVEVSKAAEQAGAQMVSIHGRARANRHTGEIDYNTIAAVKKAVSVPVIGNGGIFEVKDAIRMVEATGCDGVMIGRGGYGRPWFFRDCAEALRGDTITQAPDPEELRSIMRRHLEGIVAVLGDVKGVRNFRKCAAWYFKDLPFGTYFRDLGFRAKSQQELLDLVDAWIDHIKSCKEAQEAGVSVQPPTLIKQFYAGEVPPWMLRKSRVKERSEEEEQICSGS